MSGPRRPERDLLETLAGVLADLRADADVLSGMSHAARGLTPGTPPAGGTVPDAEVRRHAVVLLDALTVGLSGGDRQESDLRADLLAADRAAQGVPLAVLLDGVASARGHLVAEFVGRARAAVDPDQLLDLLPLLDAEMSRLHHRMILAHAEEERRLARTSRSARLAALRELVASGDAASAVELGLDPGRRFRVLVAAASTPQEVRSTEPALGGGEGATGLVRGYLVRVAAHLPAPERVGGTLVVASPPVAVGDVPAAHVACRRVVERLRADGRTGLVDLLDEAVGLALSAQPLLGRLLAERLLAGLDPGDDFHRQVAETGAAHLAQGGRLQQTAAALHLHPNTVAHRLRRLGDLTGYGSVDGAEALVTTTQWWWALRSWLTTTPA